MKKAILKSILLMLVVGYVVSVPIYGQAGNLKNQGNIVGFEEKIRNMQEDFNYLESEIRTLKEECD